ncbi:MAG TPA: SDR family oxidoreductase [Actinomycetota bacterium]|jgi:NAD(P)-dependent dehydrogenase (short-subunit alcohol dehydrogenase family)|nr:SDR family oxidoreductase [Actinomycetota bacterium]
MGFDFRGSVSVVTGGASGIGRASALAFAREGSDVVVSDINEAGAKDVAAEVEALGRKALVVRTDVSKRDEVDALVAQSIEWQGHCDLFHSNAGIGLGGAPHLIPMEEWDSILAINLHSHVWAIHKLLPHMLERGSGHLVHTASSAGTLGFPQLIPYCVTKFGVVGLCESLAGYLSGRGVGVSVVCPLLVATNIFERSWNYSEEDVTPEIEQQIRAFMRTMMQTGLPPENVAADIVHAVKENQLYVFPHPELKTMIDAKWRDPDEWVRQQAASWNAQVEATRAMIESGTLPEAPSAEDVSRIFGGSEASSSR